MSGLQSQGFRPSAALAPVRVNPKDFVIDPNLIVAGFRSGFKTGTDIIGELDELELRSIKKEAAKKELAAAGAKADAVVQTTPGAIQATNATNDAVTLVAPVKAAGDLTGIRVDQLKAAQAADALTGKIDPIQITPIDSGGSVVTDLRTGQSSISRPATAAKAPRVTTENLVNQTTGKTEVVEFRTDPETGEELSRKVLGEAPSATTRPPQQLREQMVQTNLAIKNTDKLISELENAKKAGNLPSSAGLYANAISEDNKRAYPLRLGARAVVSEDTRKLAGAVSVATTEIRRNLTGASATDSEKNLYESFLPQQFDLNNIDDALRKARDLKTRMQEKKGALETELGRTKSDEPEEAAAPDTTKPGPHLANEGKTGVDSATGRKVIVRNGYLVYQ